MEESKETGPVSTGYNEAPRHMKAAVTVPPETIAPFGYLTPQNEFGDVERGNPLPYTLPAEQRVQVGLERESWHLEVIADPESNTRLDNPLTLDAGTVLSFTDLMGLADRCGIQLTTLIFVITENQLAEAVNYNCRKKRGKK
ncbi:MAG: hypothetical protein R3C14_20325 [Caldilineaceae bacterium]